MPPPTLLSRVDDKFEEALFFLGHLQRESSEVVRNPPQSLRYYLNAFLCAAVSVLQIVHSERRSLLKDWKCTLLPPDRDFLGRIEGARGKEVHNLQGAPIDRKDEPVSVDDTPSPHLHPAYGFHWVGPPAEDPPQLQRVVYYFPFAGSSPEVTQACRFLDLLDKLRHFLKQHPSL